MTNPTELQWRHSSLIKFQSSFSNHHQLYENMQYPFNVLVKEEAPLFPTSADIQKLYKSQQLPETADTHENDAKVKNHRCEDCGKSFAMKHHLTSHMKIHAGIRPHMCKECGKTFTHKHCLNTHLLLHSSERPHQCEECKKTFTLKHHLVKHAKVTFCALSYNLTDFNL